MLIIYLSKGMCVHMCVCMCYHMRETHLSSKTNYHKAMSYIPKFEGWKVKTAAGSLFGPSW